MATKSGVHPEYHQILDGRHDLMAEAEVAAVTEVVAAAPELVNAEALRVEPDCPAGADAAHESRVRVFRLPGQSWTQVFCPMDPSGSFKLGKRVSERLETRCLQIEVTDDAWGGHVLFDRGEMQELSLYCTGYDLKYLCPKFGLPVPEIDEDEIYEPLAFCHSELRPGDDTCKLESLARLLGLWVDAGHPVWEPRAKLERLDLLYRA